MYNFMDLLNEGPILGVHFKYRHWFHSSIIDEDIQKLGKKIGLGSSKNIQDSTKIEKKNQDTWVLILILL